MSPYRLPDSLLEQLLLEDTPYGDATSFALGLSQHQGVMHCVARYDMVLSGSEEAQRMAELRGLQIMLPARPSGSVLSAGSPILSVQGAADALHAVWKPAQTLMEYLSGIASATAALVAAARQGHPHANVACTRKSFPGAKAAAIKAILAGGATPHRLGLSETLLLFAEHRTFLAGHSPAEVVSRLQQGWGERKVVVEVSSVAEAQTWIDAGAEVIQLEKCTPAQLAEVVAVARQRNPRPLIPAAGGATPANAAAYAQAGADILVSSAPYSAAPKDVAVSIRALTAG